MRITWIFVAVLSVTACSRPSQNERQRDLLKPIDHKAQLRKLQQVQSPYDEQGRLLASSEVVAGLRLPRGLKVRLASKSRWTYQTEVPLEKLHWYLSGHLQTTQIRRASGAVTYVAALPREATGASPRIDVTVGPDYPNLKQNVIEISVRPPLPTDGKTPMSRFLQQVEYEKTHAY